ncbi:hypothetical protein CTI12_AA221950 [Artemisia annua]|uniref:Uncharacterized protein n=1 Tax=Artemisia annua TaxID=35608 RepID=A0A2U1NW12_ARTAN|nr:hypothetical protein CTI12_AA221950 [Artemisia annua]
MGSLLTLTKISTTETMELLLLSFQVKIDKATNNIYTLIIALVNYKDKKIQVCNMTGEGMCVILQGFTTESVQARSVFRQELQQECEKKKEVEVEALKRSMQSGMELKESHFVKRNIVESRSMPPGIKASLLAKIREYRNDLNILKSEIKRLHSSNANVAERDELLESRRADIMQELDASPKKFLDNRTTNKASAIVTERGHPSDIAFRLQLILTQVQTKMLRNSVLLLFTFKPVLKHELILVFTLRLDYKYLIYGSGKMQKTFREGFSDSDSEALAIEKTSEGLWNKSLV